MAAKVITINVANEENLAENCRMVADAIDAGYFFGMVSNIDGDTWDISDAE